LAIDLTQMMRELLADDTQLDRQRLGELMHPDFIAHRPDGTVRTRGIILARPATLFGPIGLDTLGAHRLDDRLALLRFRLRRGGVEYLGAALWQHDQHWRIRFQQLTPVSN
jgi:hypothetical protein